LTVAASLPTIVLVVFDTARLDRFGCYMEGDGYTPTVDSLAREGLRVETMISNGPWTQPSHGSLFTGLYPTQHGCQWQTGNRFRDSVALTMAEWLQGLGYETVCATNNGLISPRTGLARGFQRYAFRLDLERGSRRIARRLRKAFAGGDSGGRIINGWVRRALREAGRPLFLFVNYVEPHWAYAPPRRLERRVDGPRFGFLEGLRYRLGVADRVGPWEAVARADPRTLEIYRTLYSGEHLNVDGHLASLLDVLAETERVSDGETIVIVTSDHGEHIGEHGLADHHASLDEHLLRVPFVAWGPGIIPAGVNHRLSEFVDVLPSLARLLGADLPVPSLSDRRTDVFRPNPAPGDGEVAFSEWRSWTEKERARLARRNPSYDFSALGRNLVCVRDERYKLVRTGSHDEVLHDLVEDPHEETDVSSAHPEIASRLRGRLDEAIDSWSGWEAPPSEISEREREEIEQRLSELGYI
jgi:arylsulfatase A-like enzyme